MAGIDRSFRFWAVLAAGTALAAAQPAVAQQAPSQSAPPSDDSHVTVKGQRIPAAEAGRSAVCEAMARDPLYAAQLNAGIEPHAYLPTRLPRNPDYSAPPKVPAGSPLPQLSGSRFGVRNPLTTGMDSSPTPADAPVTDLTSGAAPGGAGTSLNPAIDQIGSPIETAIATCRGIYARGGGDGMRPDVAGAPRVDSTNMENGKQFMPSPQARFLEARARIVRNDRTLPMAFALFDEGRYAESLDWFRKASNKLSPREGGDEATLFVGKLYLQGLGDKSDPAEAVKWLKKTATAPFSAVGETPIFDPDQPERNTAVGEAATILANLYRNGFRGITKNPAEARRWYARAIEVGHLPAAKVMGDLYFYGIDTPRDVRKAMGYYSQAAKYDYAPAQVALADILSAGEDGIAQNRKTALGWYLAAARRHHPDALFALARAYDLGDGVPADPQRALGFYKTAALNGSAAAKVSMGTYFYEGKLVAKDDATARRWFEAAASEGDADGMFDLAAMMRRGEGGPKDIVGAWVWLKRAAQAGQATAPQAVAAIESRMTPEERQAAAARLSRR